MAQSGNLNKLVASLSIEERQNLLEKLTGQSSLSSELLYVMDRENDAAEDIGTEYSKLPWYYLLWYYILSLFKSKPAIKIFEDSKVSVLGAKINEKNPGLYDFRTGMLLPVFHTQMGRLKEAAHFFYSALDSSVNRDKGAFFAFLASLEMPDIHRRLQKETYPQYIAETHRDTIETELRQIAIKGMDEALLAITEDYRNNMYFNARSLNCLKGLSSFLYDRVLMAFNYNKTIEGNTCPAGTVRELLVTLNNILLSLRVVPSMTLLESLFVFILQDKAGEQGFDINREIHLLLAKAEESLTVIREFNSQVPLTGILRCFTRDMSLSPHEISGGEDWFVYYRDHWKRRIDSLFADYLRDSRTQRLMDSFRHFFKGKDIKMLENAQTGSNSDGLPVKGVFALSFLNTFYSAVFMPDLNLILQPVFLNGEFQKKENRAEFSGAYSNLTKLNDGINKFDWEISPDGEYGKRYAQARKEMASLPVKRRKMEIVIEEAEDDAAVILEKARSASRSMIYVLSGFIDKEPAGKYYALMNLSTFAEKNKRFVSGINEAIMVFKRVLELLDEIEVMESGR